MKKLQVLQQVERHELNPLVVSPEALAERAVFHALPLGDPIGIFKRFVYNAKYRLGIDFKQVG